MWPLKKNTTERPHTIEHSKGDWIVKYEDCVLTLHSTSYGLYASERYGLTMPYSIWHDYIVDNLNDKKIEQLIERWKNNVDKRKADSRKYSSKERSNNSILWRFCENVSKQL